METAFSSEFEGVKLAYSINIMASGKTILSKMEDFKVASSTEAAKSLTALPSITTSEEIESLDDDSPPDGGLVAWLQVLGGCILFMNSRGMTNTFGAFQTYYSNTLLYGTSPSNISWIGSLQTFTLMLMGVLSGRLLDAGHLRMQLCAGIFLEVLGMMMTSVSTKYWEILVSQGICVGLGAGLLYLPSVAVPAQHFSSKIMLATGLVATGSSIAGVVYPILIRQLISRVQFPWTMRCLALIVLVTNCAGLTLMRPRLKTGAVKPPFTINISIFLDSPYVLFVLAMTFLFTSAYIPYFYLQEYARTQITNQELVVYILSIMNTASFFGRICSSWLADWNRMSNLILVSITCLLSGATVSAWLAVRTGAGTIAFAIMYGFISGGLVSLPPPTVAALSKTRDEYSTRMGFAFTVCSFGALVGNPVAGALLVAGQKAGGKQPFLGPWLFAGGTMILAAVFTMGAYYLYINGYGSSDNSGRDSSPERRRRIKWLRSLANEALAMQGAAFAL